MHLTVSFPTRIAAAGGMFLACWLLLAACSNTEQSAETSTRRIVSASPVITEYLFALGLGDELVAVDVSSTYPKAADTLPKIGYHRALSSESILSQRPDLVLAAPEAGPPNVLQQLRESGVQLEILPLGKTLEANTAAVKQLGKLLQVETRVDSLLQQQQQTLQTIEAPEGEAPTSRVLALYARGGPDRLHLIGSESTAGYLVRQAGGELAVETEQGMPLTPEAVLATNADMLLMPKKTLEQLGGADALAEHPVLGQLAYQNVLTLPGPHFFGLGPNAAQTIARLNSEMRNPTQANPTN